MLGIPVRARVPPAAAAFALLVAVASPARAQRLDQDELDLLANSNVVQGSGARALGMGGAFLARADDATAASWNPAGLSYLRQPEISAVWANSHVNVATQNSDGSFVHDTRDGNAPDFIALTYPVTAGPASGAVQVGFQRVLSFSYHRTIDEPLRQRTVDSSGGFDVLAIGGGLRVSRQWRLGFVVNRWLNGYTQDIAKQQRLVPSQQHSDFSLRGWNVDFGLMFSPWESLNLGATFKSDFTSHVSLSRSRADDFVVGETTTTTTNAYSADNLFLTLPAAVGVGASWRPRSNLTLSLDYTRSFWSHAQIENYFTLQRTDPGQAPPKPSYPTDLFPLLPWPNLSDTQHNTDQLRAGVEYVVLGSRVKWPLRAGFFTDQQYFADASGEAPTFHAFTAGTGLIVGPMLLDFAYIHEHGSYTDTLLASNSVTSNLFYASIIYRHQRKP
jgi:long-subunit fatty acid transport protein